MKRLLLFLGLSLILSMSLFAQSKNSPYRSGLFLDGPILLGSGVGLITANVLNKNIEPLTAEEIGLLDRTAIGNFDRSATMKWSPKSANAAEISMYGSFALPALLMIDPAIRNDVKTIGFMTFESFIITDFLTLASHGISKRSKPFLYNQEANIPEADWSAREARYSMFAGHTARTAAMSFMSAKIFSDYHPESKGRFLVWTAAVLLPTITGYLQYKSGEHFPSDIITGYVVGAGVGLLVPTLHKKKRKKSKKKKGKKRKGKR